MKAQISIRVRILPDGKTLTIFGREAWAVRHLIDAGDKGVTTIDTPGPRWSSYVFDLKAMGLDIETRNEKQEAPSPAPTLVMS
jgi:hypothetical protein